MVKLKEMLETVKQLHFDYLHVFFKLCVVYLRKNECKRHRWVSDIDPPGNREPRY